MRVVGWWVGLGPLGVLAADAGCGMLRVAVGEVALRVVPSVMPVVRSFAGVAMVHGVSDVVDAAGGW